MVKMSYIFIGPDGSMGLEHGKTYILSVKKDAFDLVVGYWVKDTDSFLEGTVLQERVYSSEKAFRQNWKKCE